MQLSYIWNTYSYDGRAVLIQSKYTIVQIENCFRIFAIHCHWIANHAVYIFRWLLYFPIFVTRPNYSKNDKLRIGEASFEMLLVRKIQIPCVKIVLLFGASVNLCVCVYRLDSHNNSPNMFDALSHLHLRVSNYLITTHNSTKHKLFGFFFAVSCLCVCVLTKIVPSMGRGDFDAKITLHLYTNNKQYTTKLLNIKWKKKICCWIFIFSYQLFISHQIRLTKLLSFEIHEVKWNSHVTFLT